MSTDHGLVPGVIRAIQDDIIALDIEAIVFYARPDLVLGSGFGTAISVRGGPGIQDQLKTFGRLDVGQAVMTSGGNLKARHIVHAVGPRFQEDDIESKLRGTMLSALRLVENHLIGYVAFPAMGAGFCGIPLDVSAWVAVSAASAVLQESVSIKEVVFCLRDSREYDAYQAQIAAAAKSATRQAFQPSGTPGGAR